MKMINPCTNCANYPICEKACPEFEKLLPPETQAKERPVSEVLRESEEDDRKDVPDVDRIRKIDRGARFLELQDQETVWDSTSYIAADEWSEKDKKAFKLVFDKGFRYGQTKLKRRFFAFLRCDSMTTIAARANTSKQNIQQAFQRAVERIAAQWERKDRPSTPLKFKSMIPVWK